MTWKVGDPAPGWEERTITPDCGHTVTVSGFAAGYGTDPDTGRTSCYECCNTAEREAFMASDRYVAYVSSTVPDAIPHYRGQYLTTWPGGRLARVTGHTESRTGFHRSTVHRYWFRADDGSEWFGSNGGPGMFIRVRRIGKGQK